MLLLECGVVKHTYASAKGREAILSFSQPGNWIDQSTAVFAGCHSVSATACTSCRIYGVDLNQFRLVIASSAEARVS